MAAAVESYRRSLERDPAYLPSLYNLGLVLHETGNLGEAEACFRRLLAAQPGDIEALFHLGALLQTQARHAEAASTFRAAAALAPHNAHVWLRLGQAGFALNTEPALDDAARAFRRAAELDPTLFEARFNLGLSSTVQGRYDEAARWYGEALALRPGHAACEANLLEAQQRICDWSRFDELCERRRASARADLAEEPLPAPFGLLSIPSTLEEQLAAARAWSRRRTAVTGVLPARPFTEEKKPRRLRIGYLSADFHEHVTAHVMIDVFEQHDRRRFETVALSYGPDDGSAIRSRLARAFERFIDLRPLSNVAAAAAIREQGIDILIDLKGHTLDARTEIVALRPAPLQVSYLGYPASMGADFIDYIVTDRFVLPPQDLRWYAEKPIYLPGSYYPSDRGRPVGEAPPRAALGLPESAFVFCCFNQAYKITPAVFAAWMRLLRDVPGSVLWLLEMNRAATDNLRAEAQRQGIDPARLIFAPRSGPAEYLRRLRAADLFLDTAPYNAHTTASDALWVGLPVVTYAGATLPSRVAASQLRAIGLPELAAESLEGYEALARRLARAPQALGELRAKLARSRESAPLFDTPRYVRNLEAAFEAIWSRYVAGSSPGVIEI